MEAAMGLEQLPKSAERGFLLPGVRDTAREGSPNQRLRRQQTGDHAMPSSRASQKRVGRAQPPLQQIAKPPDVTDRGPPSIPISLPT